VDTLYPHLPTLGKLSLGLAIGFFVGIDRERREKEAGLRTFAFCGLLGAIGGLMGGSTQLAVLALTALLVTFLNMETLRSGHGAELTTSAAIFITTLCGVLAGQGHTFTPTTLGIATAALLAWKEPLKGFGRALTASEVRSAVLLGILAFVVYPVLPSRAVDPWQLIDPQQAWVTVILVAALDFGNYVLLKLYGMRGLHIAAFLGGLVNSVITVTEIARRAAGSRTLSTEVAFHGIILASIAMLARNAVILGLLAPRVLASSGVPFVLLIIGSLLAIVGSRSRDGAPAESSTEDAQALHLGEVVSPFALSAALRFGALFLFLQIVGALAQRWLGSGGFYVVSVLGGSVSSATAVASAANLANTEAIQVQVAAIGAVLASLASAAANIPVIARIIGDRPLTRRVAVRVGAMVILAIVGFWIQFKFPTPE